MGISQDQIQLEKSFKLKLGRTTVEVGSNKPRSDIGGRLDVLVKNIQGENLFIVELKGSNQKLTDDDTKQGISYARLLEQIAPFVVISNGHESKIFDTITMMPTQKVGSKKFKGVPKPFRRLLKSILVEMVSPFSFKFTCFLKGQTFCVAIITMKQLSNDKISEQSNFWANGRALASTDDLRIRYEALKQFIGYSIENVRIFSKAQQVERLRALLGDTHRRSKKYIPEIYLPRKNVRAAIDLFIQGTGLSFALVGESGVGKTNEMCALAESLGEKHITLFFGAGSLCKGLLDTLTDEFNWGFSDQLREQELMRRLDELANAAKCNIIIIVDALDEAEVPTFERSVSDFAARLGQFGGRIKLVVSVKSTEWRRFEKIRGDDSALKLSLDRSWQQTEGGQGQELAEAKHFMLHPLNDSELDEVIPKYVDFFQLGGVPKGVLRNLCRSPFMIRVISEVYAGQGALPQDMSEEMLINAWLKKKLEKVSDPSRIKLDLIAFAQSLYDKLCESTTKMMTMPEEEKVPEILVCKTSSSSLNQELFAQGILIRHEDEYGRASFSFYYGRVRDFVIARYLLELDKMDDSRFSSEASILLKNRILQSALIWHLQFAPRRHRQILLDHIGGQAVLFLSTYQRILDELVPALKPNLEPYAAGEIGLAYQWHDGWLSYGLFPLEAGEKIRDLSYVTPINECHIEARKLGVTNWRFRSVNFGNADPEIAAAIFALERIVKASENGWLDETGSDVIVKESIFAIVSKHQSELELNDNNHLVTLEYPLDLQWLDQRLQAFFGKRYYHHQWMQEQIDTKSKFVTHSHNSNGIVFHSISNDPQAIQSLNRKADSEVKQGKRFNLSFNCGEDHLELLVEYVNRLKSRFSMLEPSPIPETALSINPYENVDAHLSIEQVKSILEYLFHESFLAYKQLVETNFSGLLDSDRFKKTKAIVLYHPRSPNDNGWEITLILSEKYDQQQKVQVYLQPDEADMIHESNKFVLKTSNATVELDSFRRTGFYSIMGLSTNFGFRFGKDSTSSAHQFAPIRACVYEWIMEDVKKLTVENILQRLH